MLSAKTIEKDLKEFCDKTRLEIMKVSEKVQYCHGRAFAVGDKIWSYKIDVYDDAPLVYRLYVNIFSLTVGYNLSKAAWARLGNFPIATKPQLEFSFFPEDKKYVGNWLGQWIRWQEGKGSAPPADRLTGKKVEKCGMYYWMENAEMEYTIWWNKRNKKRLAGNKK